MPSTCYAGWLPYACYVETRRMHYSEIKTGAILR